MNPSRPKIVLFSGDFATESPEQNIQTAYTELPNESKTNKKVEAYDEAREAFPQHHLQKPSFMKPKSFELYGTPRSKPGPNPLQRQQKMLVLGALLGIAIAAILANWTKLSPDNHIDQNAAKWISLIGVLYLRCVFCIVIPYVLTSIAVCTGDILSGGKGARITVRVFGYFFLTKILAVCTALAMALAFRSKFAGPVNVKPTAPPTSIVLTCGYKNSGFMSMADDGTLSCKETDPQDDDSINFIVKDRNNAFVQFVDPHPIPQVAYVQAVIQLINTGVPENIVTSLLSKNIFSVAMFAILFGAAVNKSYHQHSLGSTLMLSTLRQFNCMCEIIMRWLLHLSPIGVCFMIVGAAASGEPVVSITFVRQAFFFILAYLLSVAIYSGAMLPALFYITTKSNPYKYLMAMVPAQIFAFGCSSSAATIPITIRCIESTREVSGSLNRFVVTLGAALNKDGTAMYLPLAFVFLLSMKSDANLDAGHCVALVFLSIVASVVTLPLPNSAPLTLFSIWSTLQQPDKFPADVLVLTSINWLVNRLTTAIDVTGNAVVARIIADQVEEHYDSEHDQSAF
ncbi:hypothetical protein LEN26_017702 [Aphanomyces euteiches]|nr:hypothetical protein LEN26_017702 [Aphanomyces euteiches]KAH9115963.1 hypothetical protein AeMF1_010033 [Aphanomyces euteiches]KAH9194435.1 hypothetical protein AeNC1_003596 [Aphanomyces euteiches]